MKKILLITLSLLLTSFSAFAGELSDSDQQIARATMQKLIDNLCKVYGKGNSQVTALDHVSLTINKGEFTAIIRITSYNVCYTKLLRSR